MRYLLTFLFCLTNVVFSQTDFSNQWKDLYSYNNVKDFILVGKKLYAISENAMFIYDIETDDTQKFSSVNGLSGSTTSSISFDENSSSVVIGYENGLIEVLTVDNKVIPITGVRDNNILVNKIVNGFYSNENQSYIFGDFGVTELNVEKFEFGDTYTLSSSGASYSVNQVIVEGNVLYAATNNGLYELDLSLNPTDFNNWIQISTGNITNLIELNEQVYFSKGSSVYEITNPATAIITVTNSILNLDTIPLTTELVITMSNLVDIYETSTFVRTEQIQTSSALDYTFTTTKAIVTDTEIYMNTTNFGVLKTELLDKINYTEIHPNSPFQNSIFSITVSNNKRWAVYGGYSNSYDGNRNNKGLNFFDEEWKYLSYSQAGSIPDLTRAIIDPLDNTRVLIGSYDGGVLEFNDYNYVTTWNQVNTLGVLPGHNEVSPLANTPDWVADLIVDNNDMVWVGNSRARDNKIFSMYDGSKSGVDRWVQNVEFPRLDYNDGVLKGLGKMSVDSNNNILAGTRRNGLLIFNANNVNNESERKITVLNDSSIKGGLPSNRVLSVVADENNRIWIGTESGLVVYTYDKEKKEENDNEGLEYLYDNNSRKPVSTIIFEEDGEAKELLGTSKVFDIIIDLAGNKWFATENGGVIQTSSDGQTTYNTFETSNSPLPSNTILDLELDKDTGEIYIVTEKGMLVYDSKNEPFGTSITDVVAYPNPAIRNQAGHENITIVAKDGNGIPDGTNVKIMDVSGKLVYETNINSFSGSLGGKITWDKRNLSGKSVVSGIYIVLLSNSDGTETTTTKIAIVN